MYARSVKLYYSDDGLRRLEIYQRTDGHFGFVEEMFSSEPREMAWIPLWPSPEPICESEAVAEREARARIDWRPRQEPA